VITRAEARKYVRTLTAVAVTASVIFAPAGDARGPARIGLAVRRFARSATTSDRHRLVRRTPGTRGAWGRITGATLRTVNTARFPVRHARRGCARTVRVRATRLALPEIVVADGSASAAIRVDLTRPTFHTRSRLRALGHIFGTVAVRGTVCPSHDAVVRRRRRVTTPDRGAHADENADHQPSTHAHVVVPRKRCAAID